MFVWLIQWVCINIGDLKKKKKKKKKNCSDWFATKQHDVSWFSLVWFLILWCTCFMVYSFLFLYFFGTENKNKIQTVVEIKTFLTWTSAASRVFLRVGYPPPRPSPQTLCMALNAASEVLVTSVCLPHRRLSQVIHYNTQCKTVDLKQDMQIWWNNTDFLFPKWAWPPFQPVLSGVYSTLQRTAFNANIEV